MSIRPSVQYRNAVTALPADINYVVIGDTALAVIYARKLIESFGTVTHPVYLLTSGNNQTTNSNVESLNYIPVNSETIDKCLKSARIHLVLSSNEIVSSALDRRDILFEQYYNYYSGAGPLGDSITAYYQPLVGPWFQSDSSGQIETFVKRNTIQQALSQNEMIAATNIATLLGLSMTQSIVATKPSILTMNNIFVYYEKTKLERHIFSDELSLIPHNNVIEGVNNIFISPNSTGCLNSVSYTTLKRTDTSIPPLTPVVIENACVLWMDNIYDYVKTLGLSSVFHKKVQLPVFYRMIFAIPLINPVTGIDLSNLNPLEYPLNMGDGVTTRLTFCCTDVQSSSTTSLTPVWNTTVYTCSEDYANTVNSGGTYAAEGQTLLIIEAISLTNRRVVSWDDINTSVSVNLNPNAVELERYNAFLLLCANIYMAYTGNAPLLPIVGVQSVCSNTGVCSDFTPLEHSSAHESPMITVTRLLSSLYNNLLYPTPSTNNGPTCCG